MKKILVLVLFCSAFVIGCNNQQDKAAEEVYVNEVITETGDVNDDNVNSDNVNSDQQDQSNIDVIEEALRAGMEQRNAGNFEEAIKIYTKAIEQNPNDSALYASRSVAKREMGDFDGALEDVNKALEINPEEGGLYAERGSIYSGKGEKELAINDFKKGLSLDSSLDWVKTMIQELESK